MGGMTCPKCVKRVKNALEALPSVESATVDLAEHSAVVRWSAAPSPVGDVTQGGGVNAAPPHGGGITAVLAALDEAGYPSRLWDDAAWEEPGGGGGGGVDGGDGGERPRNPEP